MRRFWDKGQDDGDIEARLRAERPEPSDELVDRITGQLADGQRRREISKTRAVIAVVFASLVLMSGFGAAALAAGGGNEWRQREQWHSGRVRRGPGPGHGAEPELLNAPNGNELGRHAVFGWSGAVLTSAEPNGSGA